MVKILVKKSKTLYNDSMSKLVFYEIESWETDYIKKVIPDDAISFSGKKLHEEDNAPYYQ
jgi:hypothetical protein